MVNFQFIGDLSHPTYFCFFSSNDTIPDCHQSFLGDGTKEESCRVLVDIQMMFATNHKKK